MDEVLTIITRPFVEFLYTDTRLNWRPIVLAFRLLKSKVPKEIPVNYTHQAVFYCANVYASLGIQLPGF